MKKLQLLHDYLLASGLVTSDQLDTTVTEGTVVFHVVGSPATDVAFIRRYTAQISVSAWGGDIDRLDAALVWWLGLYQPELVGDENGYGFEAEILNKETVSLYTLLPLTERVRYDRATDTMHNCTTALVWDTDNYPAMPLFIRDDVTGDETEVGNES